MKNITSNDPLYVGYEINYTEPDGEKKKLSPYIRDVVKPRPNNTFLWMGLHWPDTTCFQKKAERKNSGRTR
jgi:hypothetical protein